MIRSILGRFFDCRLLEFIAAQIFSAACYSPENVPPLALETRAVGTFLCAAAAAR